MDPLTMTMVACVAALMKVKGNGYDLGSLFSSDRQKKPSAAKAGKPTPQPMITKAQLAALSAIQAAANQPKAAVKAAK